LHIGSARTALYSWLFARQHGGQFVLRIEDTDRERSTDEAVQVILDAMAWLGLDYDQGPYYQTRRMERYREVIEQMLNTGHAYRCYCSREELEQMREDARQRGAKPRYDGRCRNRKAPVQGIDPVVRFRNPVDGDVVIDDMIKGRVVISNSELDDLIIARSDGTPTYNFCVVVDDLDMEITHVIRGDDHLNNTPRQINILRALGATLPRYGHIPMILGADGKRLSKRHGAVSVLQYREDGYLPDALLNYLVRLGWSHGDQEIFSRREMIDLFNIENVQKGAAVFNPEKLTWLNYEYIKNSAPAELCDHARPYFARAGIDVDAHENALAVLKANQERSKTLVELVERSEFFFRPVAEYDPGVVAKYFGGDAAHLLSDARVSLAGVPEWNRKSIHDAITGLASAHGVGLGKVAQPVRVAVAGGPVSPPIDETLEVLGKAATLERLDAAIARVGSTGS